MFKLLLSGVVAAIAGWFGPVLQTFHNRLWARLKDMLYWLVDVLFDIGDEGLAFVTGMMPPGVADWLNQRPWMAFTSYLDDVDYFIPVWGMLAIVVSAFTLAAGIRLARWIVSMLPFVGSGA